MGSERMISASKVLENNAIESELASRGFSRRGIAQALGLLAVAGTAGTALAADPNLITPFARVRIDGNECPVGPMPQAIAACTAILPRMNRYEPGTEREELIATVARVERLPSEYVVLWPGSADPLNRAVVAYASPTRGLVTADPVFEPAGRAGELLGAKVSRIPLTKAYAHDVRAMYAANPDAGIFYICNPNNPTGTLTSLEDIAWLADRIRPDAIVLVDEAYVHYAPDATALELVRQGKNVVILRTFSKIFGMAGMRLGLTLGRPELVNKIQKYGPKVSLTLPVTAIVAATASLNQQPTLDKRRLEVEKARAWTFAELSKRGFQYTPARANHFLVDWRRPGEQVRKMLAANDVAIGRSWPILPNCSRVSVGSSEDMRAFVQSVDRLQLT